MGETTDQIENYIQTKREDLHANLQELQAKVRSATDWRQYFQKYTGTLIAAAFGSGILISALVGKASKGGHAPGGRACSPVRKSRNSLPPWRPG